MIFTNSKQSKTPFGKNSLTYGTPCPAIGNFVFYYHHVTNRTPYHASGHLAIFYRECYGFERAIYSQTFFTLHPFPLVSRSPWARQLNLNIRRASCWYFRNIAPARLFVWITTIHNKNILVISIKCYDNVAMEYNVSYEIWTLSTIFWHTRSLMLYLFGHREL